MALFPPSFIFPCKLKINMPDNSKNFKATNYSNFKYKFRLQIYLITIETREFFS